MTKFRVHFTRTTEQVATVEVEAAGPLAAEEAAENVILNGKKIAWQTTDYFASLFCDGVDDTLGNPIHIN
jgi:hypothetical protein